MRPLPHSPLRTQGSLHSTKQRRGCSQTFGYFWIQRLQIHYGRKVLRRLDKDEWGHRRDGAHLSVCIAHIALQYIFLSLGFCASLRARPVAIEISPNVKYFRWHTCHLFGILSWGGGELSQRSKLRVKKTNKKRTALELSAAPSLPFDRKT